MKRKTKRRITHGECEKGKRPRVAIVPASSELRPKPKDTDLAWAAGFIDGEGSLSLVRARDARRPHLQPGLRPMIQVGNTHLNSLLKLGRILGGGIVTKPPDNRETSRMQWRWSQRNRHVKDTLDLIYPYLFTKRMQAASLLMFFHLRDQNPGRGRYKPYSELEYNLAAAMRILNLKGAEANRMRPVRL